MYPFLEISNLTTMTKALVASLLNHCNALYVVLPFEGFQKLRWVQNSVARLPTGSICREHITSPLKQLCFEVLVINL